MNFNTTLPISNSNSVIRMMLSMPFKFPRSKITDNNQLDSLLAQIVFTPTFNPHEGTTNILVNSGKLHLIKNEHLRTLISSWVGRVKDTKDLEEVVRDRVEHRLIPYLSENTGLSSFMREYFITDSARWIPPSKFSINSRVVLQGFRFENLLAEVIDVKAGLRAKYTILKEDIDMILTLIQTELDNY